MTLVVNFFVKASTSTTELAVGNPLSPSLPVNPPQPGDPVIETTTSSSDDYKQNGSGNDFPTTASSGDGSNPGVDASTPTQGGNGKGFLNMLANDS